MHRLFAVTSAVLLVPALMCLPARADEADTKQPDVTAIAKELLLPKPRPVETPAPETLAAAIHRGVDFLVQRQNPDGSWGSARRTKDLNIYAPEPGAHHAFRGAVSAMCVSALAEIDSDREDAQAALERGEAYLLEHLPRVRRATPDAIYNVWAHSYGIQALVRMHRRAAGDSARQAKIVDLIRQQVDLLDRYQTADGGWGYYDFRAVAKQPAGEPNSFTTATAMIALREAQEIGVEIPQRMIGGGMSCLLRDQKPDFSYLYSGNFRFSPMSPINRPGGSLGRSQACNAALRIWGDERVTDDVISTWLDRLIARNGWLSIGRKRPVPHEAWFQVAGYFYYYGHYYAALCIELLPASERGPHQDQLAQVILDLQEKDGSWWDYPLYDYHQPYGTAFALMTLERCRRAGDET